MKKQISLSLTFLFTCMIFLSSCNKEINTNSKEKIIEDSQTERSVNSKQVTDQVLIKKYKNYFSSIGVSKSNVEDVEFDFDNVFVVSLGENGQEILVANQIGFDPNNVSNFALGVPIDNDGNPAGITLIFETQDINENVKILNHYNLDFDLILSYELNNNDHEIVSLEADPPPGQAALDCIEDVYSNHGWVSIWAIVQSAVVPATAAAIAAACLLLN